MHGGSSGETGVAAHFESVEPPSHSGNLPDTVPAGCGRPIIIRELHPWGDHQDDFRSQHVGYERLQRILVHVEYTTVFFFRPSED